MDTTTTKAAENAALTEEQKIKEKYAGEKLYTISMTLHPDDDTDYPSNTFSSGPATPATTAMSRRHRRICWGR